MALTASQQASVQRLADIRAGKVKVSNVKGKLVYTPVSPTPPANNSNTPPANNTPPSNTPPTNTPPAATYTATPEQKAAWDKLGLAGQQALIKNKPTFDPSKYWLSLATNTPWTDTGTPPSNTPPAQAKVEKYAVWGKGYDINVDTSGKASFVSKDGSGQIKHYNSLDEAKAAIDKWNTEVTGTTPTGTNNWTPPAWTDTTGTPPTDTTVTPPASTYDPKNFDNSQARQDEITTNLADLYAKKPEVFNGRDAFDAFFHYWAERSAVQNKILDDFYASKQKEREIYALPSATIAKWILDNTYNDGQLAFMKENDPDKYAEVQAEMKKEQNKIQNQATLMSMAKSMWLGWDDNNNGIVDSLEVPPTQPKLDMTPEETAANDKYNTLSTEIDGLDTAISKTEQELNDKYKGTITKWQMASLVRDNTNALIDQKNDKILEAKLVQWQIANFDKAREIETTKYNMDIQAFQQKMTLMNSAYNMFNTNREFDLKQEAADVKAQDPNIGKTVDIGTSKKPNVLMWNPKTQRYDISLNGWAGWVAYANGSGWVSSKVVTGDAADLITRLKNLYWSLETAPYATRVKMLSGLGNVWADMQYIKNNLMFKEFTQAKKEWVTFGAATEGEWRALKMAASSLNWSADNQYLGTEINRLIWTLWGKPMDLWAAPAAAPAATKTTKPTPPKATTPPKTVKPSPLTVVWTWRMWPIK